MKESKRIPLLEVEDLKKYYPAGGGFSGGGNGFRPGFLKRGGNTRASGNILRAVDGVSFQLFEGETLGLVGESGCGKSTLGRQIVGLERPTGGRILYEGKDLGNMKPAQIKPFRTQLQMVFQDPYSSLNPRKHIFEILSEPMLYHGLADRGNVSQKIEALLDMTGLPKSCLGRYPREFSGGQRQRIGIARALSLNPRLLVCDEPVSALDVSIQAQILNLLRDLQKELELTCIFIGHGLGAVNYVSSRIAVMYLGRIVELADRKDLIRHPIHPYTRALFQAVPEPDPRKGKREGLRAVPWEERYRKAGESGAPGQQGCPYVSRCPFSCPECIKTTPSLEALEENSSHLVSCIRAKELREEGGQ